jgi:hypothetical protein
MKRSLAIFPRSSLSGSSFWFVDDKFVSRAIVGSQGRWVLFSDLNVQRSRIDIQHR